MVSYETMRHQSVKSAMFCLSSSLTLLVVVGGGGGGGLVCECGKADLQSDHFDSKQSDESLNLQPTCHLSPSLITSAFMLSEVRCLLLDLDPCSGTDSLGCFLFFVLMIWPQ